MHTHEYQAKTILDEYGIPVPDFYVISAVEELDKALDMLGVDQVVVKAQVHAGGRGKAGGVRLARNRQEIGKVVNELLGKSLVTPQTGSKGVIIKQVLLSPIIEFTKEYYLAVALDTIHARTVLIASAEGGMEIEEVAAKSPEKILTIPLDENGILHSFQYIYLAKFLGWEWKNGSGNAKKMVQNLIKAFRETDSMLLEINPLVKTKEGELLALDAKMTVDDNALFRQPRISTFYDSRQLLTQEAAAKEYDLSYVAMDGNIGCMVNGAGLAMATMDIIKYYHGEPANFLDVGGGASVEKVTEGFKLILKDPRVKAILVNIFGGIMNCETIAKGIIAAIDELKLKVPLVVRLEGTNVEMGRILLQKSGLNIILANDLDDAAQKVVQAAKEGF